METQGKNKTKVVSSLLWKMSERLLAQVVSFAVSVVLARVLLPEDYGLVAMVLVFITIADVFVTSGFSSALIQKKDADDLDFSTMFYCSLVCSVVIYILLFAFAPAIGLFYNQAELVAVLRVFSLKIPIGTYNAIQHAYVSRHMMFKKFFWSTLVGTVISGVVGVILACLGFGVWALVIQYMLNTIVDTLVLMVTVPWRPKLLFSFKRAKALMSFGWKVLAADLFGALFGQLRNLIIGRVYTSADLAFYTRGQQLPTLITSNLGNSLMAVLFPAMSDKSDDKEAVKYYCRRSMQVLSFVIFPLMLGLAAVAEPLVNTLFTEKWSQSIIYVQILSVGLCIGVLGLVPLQAIKAIGDSGTLLKLEFVKKPVFLMLLMAGVYHSVLLTAITMAIYELYGTVVNAFQLRKIFTYTFKEQFEDVGAALGIALVMAILVWVIPVLLDSMLITLVVKVAIGCLVYILLSMAFKVDALSYLIDAIGGFRGAQ